MFSANENLMLRQHKRRIVNAIEATMPEDILDLGANVMVMQVSCQDIGCVPLETAIIIVFPKSEKELLPGLPQSAGGSYKTKILKPMAEVETPGDVLEALPPAFAGGLKSVQRLALQLRDVVLAQLTQVGGDDVGLRRQLAAYLQGSLDEYVQHDCVPPPVEEAYAAGDAVSADAVVAANVDVTSPVSSAPAAVVVVDVTGPIIPPEGNFVLRRPGLDNATAKPTASTTTPSGTTPTPTTSTPTLVPAVSTTSTTAPVSGNGSRYTTDTVARRRQQAAATRNLLASMSGQPNHAPGLRRQGCPCCDPDDPRNVMDQMMQL
jgi:hypothetical protein